MRLPEKPKIAIVGTGAVGGFYGGVLAAAGEDVHFLMRSDLPAVQRNGLRIIREDESEFVIGAERAYGSPDAIGPCDLVIIALKATANAAVPGLVAPLLGENTAILTLQNGLGNAELMAKHFGAERILGGLCFVCINRLEPGVIRNFLAGSLSLAELSNRPSDRLQQIADKFSAAGVNVRTADSLADALWHKLIWNVPFNGLTIAAGGVTTDVILANKGLRQTALDLMEEVRAAANAHGITIKPEFLEKMLTGTEPMGAYRPSSLIDFQQGRDVEVEAIWGEPLRQGQAAGVAMPRLEMLFRLLSHLISHKR